jgi:spermidine synthase
VARGDERADDPTIRLASGMIARIKPDPFEAGSRILVVDGTPQSHVDLEDPTHLSFEYVHRIGHAIDLVRPAGAPITAVHLGAGAFTLPRYVEATRPGSRQQVVEIDEELAAFVRREMPLPRGASIRVRYGDAREVLGRLPGGIRGQADLVVSDIVAGARTPAHVTSAEYYAEVAELLAPDGVLAVNVADGAGLAFARSQAATLSHVFADVALVADPQMLKARRFGNIVAFASNTGLPFESLPRVLAGDPVPSRLVHGAEVRRFAAGAPIATDQTATGSPSPARSVFQVPRTGD